MLGFVNWYNATSLGLIFGVGLSVTLVGMWFMIDSASLSQEQLNVLNSGFREEWKMALVSTNSLGEHWWEVGLFGLLGVFNFVVLLKRDVVFKEVSK